MQMNVVSNNRKAEAGAVLAFIAVALAALLGLMGVALYTGVQAYGHNELQKTATSAAMAGASEYFTGGPQYTPQPNVAKSTANTITSKVFNEVPLFTTINARQKSISTNAGNHTVTVSLQGEIPTPLLGIIGISQIAVESTTSAKALIYAPTDTAGAVILAQPSAANATLQLEFPLLDSAGPDFITESNSGRGYIVQACNSTTCYNIMNGAQGYNGGSVRTLPNGVTACFNSCMFDLGPANVVKASRLRFVDDAFYNVIVGGRSQLDSRRSAVVIHNVELYGYSALCKSASSCGIPNGLKKYPG